jgi:hypothetical protein
LMKLKSVALAFEHWFSEFGFGNLTILSFRFVRSPSRYLLLRVHV